MQKIIFFIALLLGSVFATAQQTSPVVWKFEISDKPNVMGLYEITFTASIEDHWHMYSQNLPSPDDGPLPTVFTIQPSEDYDIVGSVEEVTPATSVFDDVFEVQVNYFDNKAIFKQLISINNKKQSVEIKGTVSYMVCNNTTCLPPNDVDFTLVIQQ